MVKTVHNSEVELADTAFPGVKNKLLVHHQNMHMLEVHLPAGGCVAMHSHPNEQAGYCVKGALELEVDGAKAICRAGSAWIIPGGAEHEATAIEASVIIEVFSPPRQGLIAK